MKKKILVCVCAACGVGKSTVIDYLNDNKLLEDFVGIDTDKVGINWWDYANSENPDQYTIDAIQKAVELAKNKNIIFASCLNPLKFYDLIEIPDEIASTYLIGLTCTSREITKRLKMRDSERMCSDTEFINAQIDYNEWFKKRAGKFQLFIDNSNQNVADTAKELVVFLKRINFG